MRQIETVPDSGPGSGGVDTGGIGSTSRKVVGGTAGIGTKGSSAGGIGARGVGARGTKGEEVVAISSRESSVKLTEDEDKDKDKGARVE